MATDAQPCQNWLDGHAAAAIRATMDFDLSPALSALLLLSFVSSFSCAKAASNTNHVEATLARGAKVVVEQTAAEFFEGRVLGLQGAALKVQAVSGGDVLTVARADVLLLDGALPRGPTPGYAICRVALEAWAGCRVLHAVAARLSVELADGARHELGLEDVLTASELSVLNISRRFQRRAAERNFVEEARSQRPRVPVGYRPAARASLLVRTVDGYHSGKVRELVEDGAYVSLLDGSPPARVDVTDCAPLPPYRVDLHRGDFVLLAPPAPAQRWLVGRIELAHEGRVSGLRADGEPFEAPVRDVVPLGR